MELLKKTKTTLTDTPRPSSSPSCFLSKRKYVHEEKPKDKLPADSFFSLFIIDDDLNMGDNSCGDCSTNNQTLSQQDFDCNNGDGTSRCGF